MSQSPEEIANATKFLLAIGKSTFETPADLLFGLSKAIAVVILTHSKDHPPAVLKGCTEEVCTIIKYYVDSGIEIVGAVDRARSAKGN